MMMTMVMPNNLGYSCLVYFSRRKMALTVELSRNIHTTTCHLQKRFKVEYYANENPLKHSEKIAYVGQRLMYPIMKKNTLPR